jgi:hypothetical protein
MEEENGVLRDAPLVARTDHCRDGRGMERPKGGLSPSGSRSPWQRVERKQHGFLSVDAMGGNRAHNCSN